MIACPYPAPPLRPRLIRREKPTLRLAPSHQHHGQPRLPPPASTWAAQPQEAYPKDLNRRDPVASRQHDRRRLNSNPPNNFGLLSPKTHQATPRDKRQRASQKGAINFWTFGPGRARPEIQKSQPFFQPISSPNTAKQRLKRAATGGMRKDFWPAFMGPPGARPNPKIQNRAPHAWRTRAPGRRSRKEAPSPTAQTTRPCRPCRLATTRQAKSQLQPAQQLRPAAAQNASGDTRRHATERRATDSTSCRPVVSPKTRRRHPNPLSCQPLRLLSPETREATTLPARKFAREATTAVIAPLLQWATCRQFGHLFPPFKDYR